MLILFFIYDKIYLHEYVLFSDAPKRRPPLRSLPSLRDVTGRRGRGFLINDLRSAKGRRLEACFSRTSRLYSCSYHRRWSDISPLIRNSSALNF